MLKFKLNLKNPKKKEKNIEIKNEIHGILCHIRLKRIKNINLRITVQGKVNISAPKRCSSLEIEKFVISKESWIKEKIDQARVKSNQQNSEINDGGKFWYLGEEFLVKISKGVGKHPLVVASDHERVLEIFTPKIPSQKTLNKIVEMWKIETVKKLTNEIFDKWEKILEVSKSSLIIKKMRGKWGYCKHRIKEIGLNTRLIHQDLKFIEYVVVHELCHLHHPNHGGGFKKLLKECIPNYKKEFKDLI